MTRIRQMNADFFYRNDVGQHTAPTEPEHLAMTFSYKHIAPTEQTGIVRYAVFQLHSKLSVKLIPDVEMSYSPSGAIGL